jgi:hypothetical protein
MAVDDYPSGSNARRHQNKLGTAISSIAGPADRAGAQPIRGSEARRAGSFLVDLRCLRFCQSYIGCPEHFNPLQQFVLLRNVLGGSYSRQPARLPHQDKPANLLIIRSFLMTSTGNPCHYNRIYRSFSWTQSIGTRCKKEVGGMIARQLKIQFVPFPQPLAKYGISR